MAAGIGEATTILSVAQIGISLSKTLITYIEEVKGAPSHIRRIGNEILTTSERLKDIGELVSQNLQTKVLNEEGINSAVRCSTECQQIINDVKDVLLKGGWQDHPKESDESAVDTSLFSTLRWPFAKVKLEVPRAELHRIKLDLSLLFSAAMVLGASTAVEKRRLAQDIPELHKARGWAAKRAEKVKIMAEYRTKETRARDMPLSDDEPEILEEFLTFKESLLREEEEKRSRERARIIQAEDEARRRKEEDAQREVERKAVEQYKKTQREQELRSAEKKDNFRNELERLGFDSAQIQVVMESSNLDFQAASDTAFVPEVRPSPSSRGIANEQETTPSTASGRSRLNLPWRRSKRSERESSPEPSLNSVLSESSNGLQSKLEFETWLLDFTTHRNEVILPSSDWLTAKIKTVTKNQDVWSRFGKLRPYWRSRIFEFLDSARHEEPEWTLYHMELSQKRSRTRLFGHRHDDQSMLLILCKQRPNDQDSQAPKPEPKIEGPGGSLPKRVTFAEGLREKAGVEEGFNATHDDALAWNVPALRERIAKLELKRNGLGAHDHERIADLNDMIDYLQDQLKSAATPTNASNTKTFHEAHYSEPTRSQPNQAPVMMGEDYVPSSSRRDNVVITEERSRRGPSPPRRLLNREDVSVASHYPRAAYENDVRIIDRVGEHSSRPGRTDHDDLVFSRDQSRRGRRERQRSYYEDEDFYYGDDGIVVRSFPDQDRYDYPRRGWRVPRRSPSRPSRQDSYVIHERPIFIRGTQRDRSWERAKSRPTQPSRQLSKERDSYPYSDERISNVENDFIGSRERTNERERWSPERQEIVIRHGGSPHPMRRNSQYLSRSESEHPYNGHGVRHGDSTVGTSRHSQALILRPGASGLPYDYVQERVLNGGIRIRGDDDIDSLYPGPAVSHHSRRPYQPSISRRSSYRDRSRLPSLQRGLSEMRHHFDSSEDEESRYPGVKRVNSEIDSPETELSDAEVIAQTLKQFTTIQDSDMPKTAISTPLYTKRTSEAAHASAGPERKISIPSSESKARSGEEIKLFHAERNEKSEAANEISNSVDDRPFLDKISEEPDVIIEEHNEAPHQQRFVFFSERPIPPSSQERPSSPPPPDRSPSREASLGSQSHDVYEERRRIRPENEPITQEDDDYFPEETPSRAAQKEWYD